MQSIVNQALSFWIHSCFHIPYSLTSDRGFLLTYIYFPEAVADDLFAPSASPACSASSISLTTSDCPRSKMQEWLHLQVMAVVPCFKSTTIPIPSSYKHPKIKYASSQPASADIFQHRTASVASASTPIPKKEIYCALVALQTYPPQTAMHTIVVYDDVVKGRTKAATNGNKCQSKWNAPFKRHCVQTSPILHPCELFRGILQQTHHGEQHCPAKAAGSSLDWFLWVFVRLFVGLSSIRRWPIEQSKDPLRWLLSFHVIKQR